MASNITKVNIGSVRKTQPSFLIRPISDCSILRGGYFLDLTQFLWTDGTSVTVNTAGAAIDATSIPLKAPLPTNTIPSGTVLDFGGKKFARLTATATAAATSLTVAALPTAVVADDTATYKGVSGRYEIKGGTLLGRTYAERDSGTAFGVADLNNDEEFYLSVYTVLADNDSQDDMSLGLVELLGHNEQIAENRLPGWSTATAAYKARVRELYQTMVA